jgi:transcription elongation factor Elf1
MSAPLRAHARFAAPPLLPPAAGLECPLCGQASGHASAGCAVCPMGRGCATLTCGRCGYRFVPEGRWRARLDLWGEWVRRRLTPWV